MGLLIYFAVPVPPAGTGASTAAGEVLVALLLLGGTSAEKSRKLVLQEAKAKLPSQIGEEAVKK